MVMMSVEKGDNLRLDPTNDLPLSALLFVTSFFGPYKKDMKR